VKSLLLVGAMLALAGCGLGESAASAAAGGASKAEEVKAAQETLESVEQRLDAAQDIAREQREAAEAQME
jgi:hypothetical protein